jgi:hypothetical protein
LDLKSWLPIPAGAAEAEQKDKNWKPIWLRTPIKYQAYPKIQTVETEPKN